MLDKAVGVKYCPGTEICNVSAMETGLGMQGRTRAILSLLGKDGKAEHAVLAYLDDIGNIIIVDNSGLGKIFDSGIPIEQYMQNVANRSISQDA